MSPALTSPSTGAVAPAWSGIEVAANVTVPLTAERVGSVEETITVSGATPMVDVQQAARSFLSTGVVVPAVKMSQPDMGGIQVGQASYLSARGRRSNDDSVEVDRLDVRISNGVTQSGYNNFATVQDVTATRPTPCTTCQVARRGR
jgi:hypothetical protein